MTAERRQLLLTEIAPALLLAGFVTVVTPLSSDAERHELDWLAYALCIVAGLGTDGRAKPRG